MTKHPATLTKRDEGDLLARNATIHFNRATLTVKWVSLPGMAGLGSGAMPKEKRFVMNGPSGTHTLLVEATDLERLNAHWTVFASDPRNGLAEHQGQMTTAMDMGLTPTEARMLIR